MMKALKVILATALLLATMALAVPGANAQLGIIWTTGFQLQNLSSSVAAVTITFYQQNGTALPAFSSSIPANGSVTYATLNGTQGPSVPTGFNGSAVISSDQQVSAILNILGNSGAYGGSASGISAGATKVGLPLIQKNNGGNETWCSIQNAGAAAASVTVAFAPRDASSGNAHTTAAATVQPGASMTIDTTQIAALGTKFVGAATVNSNQPMAAICNQTGLGASKNLLTYDGFGAGSPTVRLPLVQNGNGPATNLNLSGISVQNIGTVQTNITVTFSANTRGTFQPAPITFNNVQPGQTKTINTANLPSNTSAPGFGGNIPSLRYVGSGTITNSAGQPLVAVANQLGSTRTGSSYEGFNPAAATAKVSLPLLMNANGGFYTAFQCQNVGTTSATITVKYGPNSKGTTVPPNSTQTIAAGAAGAPISQAVALGSVRYVGSATVTSNGPAVVCVANQLGAGTGDALLTYNGTNF